MSPHLTPPFFFLIWPHKMQNFRIPWGTVELIRGHFIRATIHCMPLCVYDSTTWYTQ